MRNATGTYSRIYSPRELLILSDEAKERKAPDWVARELENLAWSELPLVRG